MTEQEKVKAEQATRLCGYQRYWIEVSDNKAYTGEEFVWKAISSNAFSILKSETTGTTRIFQSS